MVNERTAKVVAVTTMPAVISYDNWKYSAIKFVITDQANPFLVQYVTHTVRG